MAANDAYQLQGRNGFDKVEAGEVFTGTSAGMLVAADAEVTYTGKSPKDEDVSFALTAAPAGYFSGGTVNLVVVTSGTVAVFPTSADYTIEVQ